VRRAINLGRLVRDVAQFSVVNRVWWLVPLALLIAFLVLFAVVGQAVAPYAIYPMF
jgi:hypothetical protein